MLPRHDEPVPDDTDAEGAAVGQDRRCFWYSAHSPGAVTGSPAAPTAGPLARAWSKVTSAVGRAVRKRFLPATVAGGLTITVTVSVFLAKPDVQAATHPAPPNAAASPPGTSPVTYPAGQPGGTTRPVTGPAFTGNVPPPGPSRQFQPQPRPQPSPQHPPAPPRPLPD